MVTSSQGNWDENYGSIRSVNVDSPSLTNDYSCLELADFIKNDPSAGGTTFEYRLEANSAGSNGGIWTAPREYSFVHTDGGQMEVESSGGTRMEWEGK